MKTVLLVKEEEVTLARLMEKKLLALSPQSGILFVGISVEPEIDEKTVYKIWIGCNRDFSEKLMKPLVEVTLRDELSSGIKICVEAHRGIGRVTI